MLKKLFLAALSVVTLGAASLKAAASGVCLGAAGCPQGTDQVTIVNSTPIFYAIAFVDGSTQTTAGGAASGGGSASFFTFTDNSGNKTAISSFTLPASLWVRTVSGSSQTLILNPSSVTLMGQFQMPDEYSNSTTTITGGRVLTNSTTMQVVGGQVALKIIAMNATLYPFILGQNSAGTDTGIAWQNGSITTHAYIVTNSNTDYMKFGLRGKDWLFYSGPTQRIGIGTLSPTSMLHVSSGAGTNNSLVQVSTGGFRIFECDGSSCSLGVPLYSSFGVAYPTSSVGGGGGVADNLGNHTATQLLNMNGFGITGVSSITASGAGQPIFGSTHTCWNFQATDTSDYDFQVCESSIIANGVVISTDQANTTGVLANKIIDFTANGNTVISTYTWPVAGMVYSSSMCMVNTTQTVVAFGESMYTHNDSSITNHRTDVFYLPHNNSLVEWGMNFVEQSSGTIAGNRHYVVSIATFAANSGNVDSLAFSKPIAFTVTQAITGSGFTITKVTLTGWSAFVGNGDCMVAVRRARDNSPNHALDTSNNPTYTAPSTLTLPFTE